MHVNAIAAPLICGLLLTNTVSADTPLSFEEWVGKQIFFDKNLSINKNQACAECHGPEVGWSGPDASINRAGAVYEGSIPGAFGNRKPTTSAYAVYAPRFRYDYAVGELVGGTFWDGRATGWKLGNPAADQAQGPFTNPVEQALPSARDVVERVCGAWYSSLFRRLWGPTACFDVEQTYNDIAVSIASYEGSLEVSPFSSKYDAYLAGEATLTPQEHRGLELFRGKAKCDQCHPSTKTADGLLPLFTDFTYANPGVPKNPANPVYTKRPSFIDPGVAGFLRTLARSSGWRKLPYVSDSIASLDAHQLEVLARANYGKQRVPTLRNVAKGLSTPKAFTHNGFFKTLEGLVHYYNTRDTLGVTCPEGYTEADALANHCWPAPEVVENLNTREMGRLSLTEEEEDDIVTFLGTLSDGYHP